MIKPERIEQWAWDAAKEVTDYHDGLPTITEAIAAAVLKARYQAFEECAKIAEDAKFGREATALSEGDVDGSVLAAMQARMADIISQAIRQHSQKGKSE